MLAWVWRGVLAFDRIGTRIPQLVQMLLVELIICFCLGAFIAKAIDGRGGWGCPGTGEGIDGTSWGALGVGLFFLFFLFFFVRNVFWPRVVEGSWTPMIKTGIAVGGVGIAVPNRRWTAHYEYLTSHPSYVLILLPVSWIFAIMILFTAGQGCSLFYNRVFGWAGMGVIAALALCRLVAWYVLRLGRRAIANRLEGISGARASWEIAWKPVLMLVVMMHAIVFIPIGIMFWNQHRANQALPLATIADAGEGGSYRRVNGTVKGDLVLWPHEGMGRGSNNYYGGGVLVALDGGGEALLMAGNDSLPDLRDAMASAQDGRIEMLGQLLGEAVPENLAKYARFTEDDFPPRDPGGRLLVQAGVYP